MVGFKIVKKSPEDQKATARKKFTITRTSGADESSRKRVQSARFKGDPVSWPIQFPDDCEKLRKDLMDMGYDVSLKDCQALGHKLSMDHYPFGEPYEKAWLNYGALRRLVIQFGRDYLDVM